MKKIPTLFEREYENHKVVNITDRLTKPEFQDILDNPTKYFWTVKFDGTCCCVMDSLVYKRYDAKLGKKAPEGAIPCCDPDPVTSHHPHWVPVHYNDPADKYISEAFLHVLLPASDEFKVNDDDTITVNLADGTYEAIGPKINGNPYGFASNYSHLVIKHGMTRAIAFPRNWHATFEDIKYCLQHSALEGYVIWDDEKPICKIKRSDF